MGDTPRAERVVAGLQGLLLQVDVAEVVVPEAGEPNAVIDLLDTELLEVVARGALRLAAEFVTKSPNVLGEMPGDDVARLGVVQRGVGGMLAAHQVGKRRGDPDAGGDGLEILLEPLETADEPDQEIAAPVREPGGLRLGVDPGTEPFGKSRRTREARREMGETGPHLRDIVVEHTMVMIDRHHQVPWIADESEGEVVVPGVRTKNAPQDRRLNVMPPAYGETVRPALLVRRFTGPFEREPRVDQRMLNAGAASLRDVNENEAALMANWHCVDVSAGVGENIRSKFRPEEARLDAGR